MKKFKSINTLSLLLCFAILINFFNNINLVKACDIAKLAISKDNYDVNPIKLRPLSLNEINNFLNGKNVTVLAVKNINNFTVILLESNNLTSFYAFTSDENGVIKYECVGSSNKNVTDKLSIGSGGGGGKEFGTYSFNWIIIRDKDVLKNAYKVKITFKNKEEVNEFVNNKKGFIIPNSKNNLSIASITIYDEKNNVLHKAIT